MRQYEQMADRYCIYCRQGGVKGWHAQMVALQAVHTQFGYTSASEAVSIFWATQNISKLPAIPITAWINA
jgi:hypothetical protein